MILFLAVCFEIEPRIIYFLVENFSCSNKNYLSLRLIENIVSNDQSISLNSILFRENFIYFDKKSGFSFIDASLRLSESVFYFLLDADFTHPKLELFTRPLKYSADLHPIKNFQKNIKLIKESLQQDEKTTLLIGKDESLQEMLISQLQTDLNQKFFFINVQHLPNTHLELDQCMRFLRTEALINDLIYCFSFHSFETTSSEEKTFTSIFLDFSYKFLQGFYLIMSDQDFIHSSHSFCKLAINNLSLEEWNAIWKHFLADNYELFTSELNVIIEHFELTIAQIKDIAETYPIILLKNKKNASKQPLWNLCREHTRINTSNLLVPMKIKAQWEQLILPDHQKELLEQLIAQVKNRALVYRTWGLAHKEARGLGITALFSGSSGTGKTMAAEAVAEKLDLDLYRIDLSQVVSKYIGETQKNLEEVFKLAEKNCAILLFDEADSLFAKRSETKDSRDRYSNMEISYLLSRMENYRGVSLLTTNLKTNIDNAFLRRFRFVIEFYYPSETQRKILWNTLLTTDIPSEKIAIEKLAKIDFNGASIRNVLLNGAFFAAETETKQLTMQHLKKAIEQEFIKLERPISEEIHTL
ncbi:MAG: AAA family ATPase [Pseudomonadota bacterium]